MRKMILLFTFMLCQFQVWSVCDYCEEFQVDSGTSGLQLCTSVGSASCSKYYLVAHSACCSNTPSVSCDSHDTGTATTFVYQNTSGSYCNGVYYCSDSQAYGCDGDFVIASSSDCVPFGPQINENAVKVQCLN